MAILLPSEDEGGPAAGEPHGSSFPTRTSRRHGQATWLAPEGTSQLRVSAGFSPDFAASVPPGTDPRAPARFHRRSRPDASPRGVLVARQLPGAERDDPAVE